MVTVRSIPVPRPLRIPRECKQGNHSFSPPRHVGGGITRQVCVGCGTVTIDLRSGEVEGDPYAH